MQRIPTTKIRGSVVNEREETCSVTGMEFNPKTSGASRNVNYSAIKYCIEIRKWNTNTTCV